MELIINHMYIQIFSFLGALDIPRQSQSDRSPDYVKDSEKYKLKDIDVRKTVSVCPLI